jgi:hypothetical protein
MAGVAARAEGVAMLQAVVRAYDEAAAALNAIEPRVAAYAEAGGWAAH